MEKFANLKLRRIETFMRMSTEHSEDSPDEQTHVGAVLISTLGSQIASSFNGFVRGADDEVMPKSRPDKYEYMQHAERNLLYNCLNEGIGTRGCTVIVTLSPCLDCLRACYQSGIKYIIFKEYYKTDTFSMTDETYMKMPDVGVLVTDLPNGFTLLNLNPAKGFHSREYINFLLKEKSEQKK